MFKHFAIICRNIVYLFLFVLFSTLYIVLHFLRYFEMVNVREIYSEFFSSSVCFKSLFIFLNRE